MTLRDVLIMMGLFSMTVVVERILTRFRTDAASWWEPWDKAFDPANYTPRGRRLLPLLCAVSILNVVAVAVVVFT